MYLVMDTIHVVKLFPEVRFDSVRLYKYRVQWKIINREIIATIPAAKNFAAFSLFNWRIFLAKAFFWAAVGEAWTMV